MLLQFSLQEEEEEKKERLNGTKKFSSVICETIVFLKGSTQ